LIYNHQFPFWWRVPSEATVTAVDFPIHDYIPAALMKLFGVSSPFVFRLYILLYSFIGLFFLFKLSYFVTKDYIKSVFVVIFSATSPVFVYYQGGFLPTIPSLSNAIIGVYFYFWFLKQGKAKLFGLSVFFMTLAALSRTTFVIPFIAMLGVEFVRLIKRETKLGHKLIPLGISISFLVSYQLYNNYLRGKYGSIFLNYIMPPTNIEQVKEIIKHVYDSWLFQYFSTPHYFILITVAFTSIYLIASGKCKIRKGAKLHFGTLIAIYFLGCLIFLLLMMRQFYNHDYYFLDTFFLPITMGLILGLSVFPKIEKGKLKIISAITLSLISTVILLKPIKSQENRREATKWNKTEATINNYRNSALFLDSIEVSRSSKILVLDAVAPNIPFILMERRGFAVMNTDQEIIEEALKWDFDYIVIQNDYFIPDIYAHYPNLLKKLDKIADNGKISVCKLTDNNQQSLLEFIGLKNKEVLISKNVTFESVPGRLWRKFNRNNAYAYEGNYSGYLQADCDYGLTFKAENPAILKTNSRTLVFSSYFLKNTNIDCELVLSISTNGQNLYYRTTGLNNLIQHQGEWQDVTLVFNLPKIQADNFEFKLFIENRGNSDLYYDNFGFAIY